MGFEPQAVVAFYVCLTQSMQRFGDWPNGEPVEVAVRRQRDALIPALDDPHLQRILERGASVNSGKGVPHAMDMNDAHVMKHFCDVYFLKTFTRLAKDDLGD